MLVRTSQAVSYATILCRMGTRITSFGGSAARWRPRIFRFLLSGRHIDEPTRQTLMREVCGRSGVTRFLTKSLEFDQLFESLRQFCAFEMYHADA